MLLKPSSMPSKAESVTNIVALSGPVAPSHCSTTIARPTPSIVKKTDLSVVAIIIPYRPMRTYAAAPPEEMERYTPTMPIKSAQKATAMRMWSISQNPPLLSEMF